MIASENFMAGWEKVTDWLYLCPGLRSDGNVTLSLIAFFLIKFGKKLFCNNSCHLASGRNEPWRFKFILENCNPWHRIDSFCWCSLINYLRMMEHFLIKLICMTMAYQWSWDRSVNVKCEVWLINFVLLYLQGLARHFTNKQEKTFREAFSHFDVNNDGEVFM